MTENKILQYILNTECSGNNILLVRLYVLKFSSKPYFISIYITEILLKRRCIPDAICGSMQFICFFFV